MGTDEFIMTARQRIAEWMLQGDHPFDGSAYNVWHAYVLGNHKGIFGMDSPDGFLFEVTWHADTKQLYLDVYDQLHHFSINRF
jgi:hypothetical protein